MDDRILEHFKNAYPWFDGESIAQFAALGTIVPVRRKECFIEPGRNDQRIGFVLEGLFRGIVYENDEEQTLWFSSEMDIMASYRSILTDQPSNLTYEALEDGRVFVLDYRSVRNRAASDLALANSLLSMMEKLLLESFARLEKFIFYSPEDRYLRILAEKPETLNRVSQKLLASYIGVTPESLSRLRARIQEQR